MKDFEGKLTLFLAGMIAGSLLTLWTIALVL